MRAQLFAISAASLALAAEASSAAAAAPAFVVPPAPLAAAPYAQWAHSHFVWGEDRPNASACAALVAAYAAQNITVGAVDVDSGWSTGFDNFVVDPAWGDLAAFVADMHARDVNVILWATALVNTDSPNYAEGVAKGYFIRDATNATALVSWWHGKGAFLDYGNPAALLWWEAAMANVLAAGIDGWKVDGIDPFLIEVLGPTSAAGPITLPQYQNWTYGHFFNHTRDVRGPSALIWSRPVDSYPVILNISAFLTFSPKYVVFSGWVGDQDPTFAGLRDALVNIYASAWNNYTNFGSDTGGYRTARPPRTAEEFLRWAQCNAFLPLFENGGDDDHTPMWFDKTYNLGSFVTDAYRRLVAAHYELGPYLMTTGASAYAAGVSSITPNAAPPADFPFILEPDFVEDWSWRLGADIFTSPVVAAGGVANGTLPPAASGWASLWHPEAAPLPGGEPFALAVPLNESATFVRVGALLPLHVSTPLALVAEGGLSFASALTLFAHGAPLDGAAPARADVRVGGGCLEKAAGGGGGGGGDGGGDGGGSNGSLPADARCRVQGGGRAELQRRGRELLLTVSALAAEEDAQDVIFYLRGAPAASRAWLAGADGAWTELPRREREPAPGARAGAGAGAALPWGGRLARGAAARAAAAPRARSWSGGEGAGDALVVRCGDGSRGVRLRVELA
jgi:hypothetical protein